MFNLRVDTSDVKRLQKALTENNKQVTFAMSKTLNELASATKNELKKELTRVFVKPTPFILNSPYMRASSRLNLTAQVGIRNVGARANPAQYVKEHFGGGDRGAKPFELALRQIGALPNGMRAIPGEGLRLDAFGNPNRAQLTEIIGSLKTGMRSFKGKGKRQTLQGYFIVKAGDPASRQLMPGVWHRVAGNGASLVHPMFIFVSNARYQKRIDLPAIAKRVYRSGFDSIFAKNLRYAFATKK